MKIQTVTYGRLRNLGNYENDRVESTAVVERGETPEQALVKLADWVHERLGLSMEDIRQMERHGREVQEEVRLIEEKLGLLRGNYDAFKAVLAARGVDLDSLFQDAQLPF